MENKSNKAKELFLGEYNCAQSTLSVFADELKLDTQKALAIASGFGAGMGYQGLTCGVVSGAYMALGLHSGEKYDDPEMVKENTYQLVAAFNKRFKSKFDSIACKDLVGEDLSIADGIERAKEAGVFTSRCPQFVQSAVEIVNELIKD